MRSTLAGCVPGEIAQSLGRPETIGAVAIVLAITFVALMAADPLARLLGAPLLRLMARIVGILLFAIAVDFVMDGIRDFVQVNHL